MKIKKRQFRAFTLMELILTISIMGLIAGVATPVLISSQYTSELKSDAIRVEELIKKAQNLAITGSTSANTGGVPTFGYGVNFSSTGEITIFANGLNGESYRFNDGEEYTEDGGNNQIQLSNNVGVWALVQMISVEV
jgi:prepilin-type N-terminal cleavage/methylation domain-containing protein